MTLIVDKNVHNIQIVAKNFNFFFSKMTIELVKFGDSLSETGLVKVFF